MIPSTQLMPDLAAADAFLNTLDPDGVFTFQTFDDRKARKDGRLARVLHGTLAQHSDALIALQRLGTGVFVMVNRGDSVVHPNKKTCRSTDNVVAVRAVFIDLDGSPISPVMSTFAPDIVIESSPDRWHAYWLCDDCPLSEFRDRQKQIAAKFGGDPSVIDLPRVMRMPGFFHQKAEPFLTYMMPKESS